MASSDVFTIRELPDCEAINKAIIGQFNRYRDTDEARHSHHFAGRFENIYIDLQHVPAMHAVMDHANKLAQEILTTKQQLKSGFWFNHMESGQVTQPHSHDDDDECLSAVYYIDIPLNSGDLLLTVDSEIIQIIPEAGNFVFFPPNITHEVTENKSIFSRLSAGMNFGIEVIDDI